ncbi:FAD-binding protein [Sphingomonas sp.]|uniref:FAD-binding protein n=1 Tax=Sphingomonas sp. TaxID=28214 RepID=UPI002DD67EAC|nr:FAD-binding protein [Sphingomonas sp.]
MTPAAPADATVDLLVLGAGPAGMTAALVGAIEGLDVLLCEKSSQVGGTAATSAGTLWIPGNTLSRDAGMADSAEAAETYLDALIEADDDHGLRRAFLASGDAAITYLMRRSDVQFMPCGRHPDYKANRPGAAVAGRAIMPVPFDGRRLGADFARVRPPIPEFMVLGGMMVGKADIPRLLDRFRSPSAFLYSARLFVRYLTDRLRYARGTRLMMGNALVARLYASLKTAGVEIAFDSPLVGLIRRDGRVVGAVVGYGGRTRRIFARRGVVLATGGYARNADLRARLMPAPAPADSMASEQNLGEGIVAGMAIGASLAAARRGSAAFWTPVSRIARANGTTGLFPHLSLDRAKPGIIAVDRSGRRFVNEGDSYHDFVEAMFARNASTPAIPAYLVCSTAFVRRFGLGAIHPGTTNLRPFTDSRYIYAASTLAMLARQIGVDPDGLEDSARRNDAYARTGHDPDFGKGESELNRFNGDPGTAPNPCLGPLGEGPYCAIEIWPAEIGCSIGLATDADARALDDDGRVIPGLYVCGNDMNSIMAGTYPGPGTTLGPGIVFAYRLARHAAGAASGGGADVACA